MAETRKIKPAITTRTAEKARAYCDGYKQGIEELYAYIRRNKVFKEDSGARS